MSKSKGRKATGPGVHRKAPPKKATKPKAVVNSDVQPKEAKRAKMPKEAKTKKPSLIDVAAVILAEAPEGGLQAKAIYDAVLAKGLWSSPAGKTPWATLAAALVTEIAKKGADSRFKKVSPGHFALA